MPSTPGWGLVILVVYDALAPGCRSSSRVAKVPSSRECGRGGQGGPRCDKYFRAEHKKKGGTERSPERFPNFLRARDGLCLPIPETSPATCFVRALRVISAHGQGCARQACLQVGYLCQNLAGTSGDEMRRKRLRFDHETPKRMRRDDDATVWPRILDQRDGRAFMREIDDSLAIRAEGLDSARARAGTCWYVIRRGEAGQRSFRSEPE